MSHTHTITLTPKHKVGDTVWIFYAGKAREAKICRWDVVANGVQTDEGPVIEFKLYATVSPLEYPHSEFVSGFFETKQELIDHALSH